FKALNCYSDSSSSEIFLFGLKLIFVDLAARIPLTKDLERGIRLLLFAFADEPTNSHNQADDEKHPEKKHHRHHADPPTPPPHRMHFPVPLVHALLRQQRDRPYEHIRYQAPNLSQHDSFR